MTAREIVRPPSGCCAQARHSRPRRAGAALEVRLDAGEYDGMDKAALADLLNGQLNEICADKLLRVRTMPTRAARPEPGEPAGQQAAQRERRRPPHT
jgi:hypothetical protein